MKAYCLAQQKKLNKAIDVCDQGIKEHPDDGEIYCTKYAVLAKQEKYTQGLKVIERALKQKELENKKEVLGSVRMNPCLILIQHIVMQKLM